MKKLIAVLSVVSLFMASQVMASPFVVCDDPPPEDQVTNCIMEVDGVVMPEIPAPMHYDVEWVSAGNHTVRAKFKNLWGESIWSDPFAFTAGVPSQTSGLGLSAE